MDLGSLDGRVELRELIGEGGMGEVHAAWDRSLQRAVAVKFVRGSDPRAAERLLLEARLQARVEHPHVVRVFEVGSLEGRPCILFQLVRGTTLAGLAPGLALADRVELVRQAATGLHAAHLQGLVHRDVKPGNILVEEGEDGSRTALVTDFGLAHAEEGGLTRSGLVAGTLDFMAPEQLAGDGPVDFRSDVYALGATLYAALAGRPPFRIASAKREASAEEQLNLLRRILEEEAPPLRSVAPQVPRELSLIARKAMEKEAGARYASAEAFADDLARVQRGEPIRARPPGPGERILKWSRRNRAASRSIAAALAILLAAGGFSLWISRRAGLEALEAARLGAEAEQMHELLRVEVLLPPHDLSPAFARIREMLAPLDSLPPEALSGPAWFTLGRGRQLLGDHAAAYPALRRAWELGFRRPEAALALAETEGRLYARELSAVGRVDDPARRKARLDELARRYRDPAAGRLQGLSGATEADRTVLAARLAMVEQRFEDAAARAREAATAGADPLEAAELEGQAHFRAAVARYDLRDLAGVREKLRAAASSLERACAVGRSAPGPRHVLARLRVLEYDLRAGVEGFQLPPLDAIASLLREAEILDPGSSELHNVWSGVEKRRGDAISAAGGDPLAAYRAAVERAERAVAAAGSDPLVALLQAANAAHALALQVADTGDDPRPVSDRGIAAGERALALSPDTSGPVFNLAQLRTFRAQWSAERGEDAREDAARAVADARRFLALGDRPMVARNILGLALRAAATAEWARGGDPSALLAEGLRLVEESARLAPTYWGVLDAGLSLAETWAEQALADGRDPGPALAAGSPYAEAMVPLARGNVVFAARAGHFQVLRARGEVLAGRDPSPCLARAVALLDQAARTSPAAVVPRGEVELVRAEWMAARGGDPRGALGRAEALALRAQAALPRDPGAFLLQARALAALPRPARQQLERARRAAERARALRERDPRAWLADARVRRALGDRAGAVASLERAATLQPRLVEIAELRAALGP